MYSSLDAEVDFIYLAGVLSPKTNECGLTRDFSIDLHAAGAAVVGDCSNLVSASGRLDHEIQFPFQRSEHGLRLAPLPGRESNLQGRRQELEDRMSCGVWKYFNPKKKTRTMIFIRHATEYE